MRFNIFTAANIKMAVSWVVVPCSLVEFTDVSEVLAGSIIKVCLLTHRSGNGGSQHL
jgi:hypothetical protein